MTLVFNVIYWVGMALACLVGLKWAVRLGFVIYGVRQREILSESSPRTLPEIPPKISVVVAAKDEEINIETCIRSLLDQDYPDFEVIAVNDRSEDRTKEILDQLAAEFPNRLRVIHVTDLQDGWFGKNNAMREGIARSTGDWLFFTDADCRQTSTRTLSVAMNHALATDTDFLTITPIMDHDTLWERILYPLVVEMMLLWFQPRLVNDPDSPVAYSNGGFMLLSRECYLGAGGHERVRKEVNEDIHMARLAKENGFRLRMVENDDLYRIKMYRSFNEACRGWSRIFFGSLRSRKKLAASILSIGLGVLLPLIASIGFGVTALLTEGLIQVRSWNLAVAFGTCFALAQCMYWLFYKTQPIHRLWSLTFPVGASVTMTILIDGLAKQMGLRNTTWRGTTYSRTECIDMQAGPKQIPVHAAEESEAAA